jgi:hypothetical protein
MEFPKLRTGVVAQYPSVKEIAFRTNVSRFLDGTEQRFRTVKGPIHRWFIQMSQVSAEEMADIEEFFDAAQGSFGSFSFTDPWDGTEYPDCSLDTVSFVAKAATEWRWASQLIVRNNRA